jgi:hypothetical protein
VLAVSRKVAQAVLEACTLPAVATGSRKSLPEDFAHKDPVCRELRSSVLAFFTRTELQSLFSAFDMRAWIAACALVSCMPAAP